ncbi:helicase C-terminal domain-containing protein [Macrococcus capreoli]|uniref:helicase C-terminal domain-containing protein n=1 Tax=Macrococcus capreoli TaxID=2982690 RepID=UPI0021D5BAB1|nr:helicase C-terminal domain-containing protein [Macrococcus sp. TMW 2.2395]MCU7556742.1 exonuclease domain-containing protein [Macrococcus sp. TMW 2.2395]
MALKYAIVDIETTGNNLDVDEMIQIGVCIMQNNTIIDTFDSFVHTVQTIPPFIQSLTKINNHMIENAPTFHDFAARLNDMLEGCVFVAHNVDFDLNFLKKYFNECNINYQPKYIMDTVDVFKIVFPEMERYQLSYLSEQLHVDLTNAHRAIDDAIATANILMIALEKLNNLPMNTLKSLYQFAKSMRYHFDEVLFDLIREYKGCAMPFETTLGLSYVKKIKHSAPLHIDETFESFFKRIIASLDFVYRKEQYELSFEIYLSLKHQSEITIEAELGSGKTLSYLLAAAYFISETRQSVLISTSTIALQNQMIDYDIALLKHCGLPLPFQIIKSKSHYLTIEFVDYVLKDQKSNHDILILKMQLLIFLMSGQDGDIERLNLNGGRKIYFELMRSLYLPKQQETYLFDLLSDAAHIGITNHAHLLSNRKQNVFEQYQHLIIDEAHQILNYALKYTTLAIKYQDLKYIISQTLQEFDTSGVSQKQKLSDLTFFQYGSINNELHQMNEKYEQLFDYLLQHYYSDRIVKAELTAQDEISLLLHEIKQTLATIALVPNITKMQRKMIENLMHTFERFVQNIDAQGALYLLFNNHNKSGIQIILKENKIRSVIEQYIINAFDAKIFISGTINSINEHNVLSDLFMESKKYIKFESSFDKVKAPLFIPNDIPQFNYQHQDEYIEKCLEYILLYLNRYDGKALILLNSYQQVELLRDYLYDTALDQVILTQNSDVNTTKLNQQFNQLEKGVLLATQTFYEGIDFKYSGVKCVMIVSLPFMHPKDINIALMKDEVDDVFLDYQVPVAVNKLHQATGRLIRTENDKGWMICFDRRIVDSRYANKFKHILRNYELFEGAIEDFESFLSQVYKSFS